MTKPYVERWDAGCDSRPLLEQADREIELLRDQRDANLAKEVETVRRLEAEIERLRTALNRVRKEEQELAGVTYHIANDAVAGVTLEPGVVARHTLDCSMVKHPNCTYCDCGSIVDPNSPQQHRQSPQDSAPPNGSPTVKPAALGEPASQEASLGGHTVFCDHCQRSVLLPYTDATKSAVAVAPMAGWNIESELGVICPECQSVKSGEQS